ncbi:hypothetical protein RIF29_35979 [Crotalaria pallida]|uniref:Uncharacterized protein n=1 Tax=Crotalaria pallida TaxID=3830 RepID=A0AAN9EG79_CROPI
MFGSSNQCCQTRMPMENRFHVWFCRKFDSVFSKIIITSEMGLLIPFNLLLSIKSNLHNNDISSLLYCL